MIIIKYWMNNFTDFWKMDFTVTIAWLSIGDSLLTDNMEYNHWWLIDHCKMEYDICVGKRVSLTSCFFFRPSFIRISVINSSTYQDFISYSIQLLPRNMSNFLVFLPNVFPVVSHACNAYVFCACVTKTKRENSNINWLD